MKSAKEIEEKLSYFIGTEQYHSHGTGTKRLMLTDGAAYIREACECFWLFDKIWLHQAVISAKEEFQHWRLSVIDNMGYLTCDDGNNNILITAHIPHTNFPLAEVKFYLINGVIMLPSEY